MFSRTFCSKNSVQPEKICFDQTLSCIQMNFIQTLHSVLTNFPNSSSFILLKTGSFNSLRGFIHRHETSICANIFSTNSGFLKATSPDKKVVRFICNPFLYLSTSFFSRKDIIFYCPPKNYKHFFSASTLLFSTFTTSCPTMHRI